MREETEETAEYVVFSITPAQADRLSRDWRSGTRESTASSTSRPLPRERSFGTAKSTTEVATSAAHPGKCGGQPRCGRPLNPAKGIATLTAVKRQLTEAEARAREERLTAAGIKVVTDAPSTVTLLRRKTTEEMLAKAKAAGVQVTVTEKATGGEVIPLMGIRPIRDERS